MVARGGKSDHWGGICLPSYIVKKGPATRNIVKTEKTGYFKNKKKAFWDKVIVLPMGLVIVMSGKILLAFGLTVTGRVTCQWFGLGLRLGLGLGLGLGVRLGLGLTLILIQNLNLIRTLILNLTLILTVSRTLILTQWRRNWGAREALAPQK